MARNASFPSTAPISLEGERPVGIVIVSYHHCLHLAHRLPSVFKQTSANVRVHVIDHHSHDGTADYVSQQFPAVRRTRNANNRGFASACNQGIRQALDEGAASIALLDPDTMTHSKWLQELVVMMQTSPRVDIVQSTIVEGNPPSTTLNTRGNCQQYLGFGFCDETPALIWHQGTRDLAFASGAACLIPKESVLHIGAMDEDYFLYPEDVDLSRRAHLAGYRVVVSPQAQLWPDYQIHRGTQKDFYRERNRLRFFSENAQTKTRLLLLPIFLLTEAAVFIQALRGAWFILKLKSDLEFGKDLPALRRTRLKIEALRTLPDREISKLLTSRLHQASWRDGDCTC